MFKERPILFSGPMVRAILAGKKTQTRRIVKPQPPSCEVVRKRVGTGFSIASATWMRRPQEFHICGPVGVALEMAGLPNSYFWTCPYGVSGDRLWVRERWSPYGKMSTPASIGSATYSVFPDGAQKFKTGDYYHGADDGGKPLREYSPQAFDGIQWRPSIHMPRWASRLTLEITAVRVERLQDITEADAVAEGCRGVNCYRIPGIGGLVTDDGLLPDEDFEVLWKEINGPKSWDANPWVWVISFKRIENAQEGE